MKGSSWLIIAGIYSMSSYGAVSFEEKMDRVEYLEKLSTKAPAIYVDAYKRELQYQKQGLSLQTKAAHEANLLAENIKLQIADQYTKTLDLLGSKEAAADEIKATIDKDLALLAPELQSSVKHFSLEALADIQSGEISNSTSIQGIETSLLSGIKSRALYLNQESMLEPGNLNANPSMGAAPQAKLAYASKAQLAQELANDNENGAYITTASSTYESEENSKSAHALSLQLKGQYLGVDIELGPKVIFSREYNTRVSIQADGMEQIFRSTGDFEFYKMRNGRKTKRLITFSCKTSLRFAAEYEGAGALKMMGTGYEYNRSRKFIDTVEKNSRQIHMPETIAGKYTTLAVLRDTCLNEFLATHLSNGWRIRDVLQIDMQGVISGLRLVHPRSRCAQDNHCFNWYNGLGTIYKANTYPRCIADTNGQGFASCELRALKGHACTVYANGKRVSTDQFERPCDGGLTCYKVREAGWFLEGVTGRLWSAPKGQCH
ncbi:MAG TPA: hypothetical protein VNJ01_17135 [Bacteriovoracaceae bacterium]|nr:hypothetical protein [Bacteriovoracaceae bacterium]